MKKLFWSGNALRDTGTAVFLAALLGTLLLNMLAPDASRMTYLMLTGLGFVCVACGFMGYPYLMAVLAGVLSGAWTVYKLYAVYAEGAPLLFPFDHLWILAPLVLVSGVALFEAGSARLVRENAVLRRQVEESVLIDTITGLENLRALYRELPMMLNQCARHRQPLSLMLVSLRHAQELRAFLTQRQFGMLRQRLAERIAGTVRLEDRLYAIDESGTVALLLIADDEGCEAAKRRLRAVISEPDAFRGVTAEEIQIAVRIAHRLCDKASGMSPIEMKLAVEAELAYDV